MARPSKEEESCRGGWFRPRCQDERWMVPGPGTRRPHGMSEVVGSNLERSARGDDQEAGEEDRGGRGARDPEEFFMIADPLEHRWEDHSDAAARWQLRPGGFHFCRRVGKALEILHESALPVLFALAS